MTSRSFLSPLRSQRFVTPFVATVSMIHLPAVGIGSEDVRNAAAASVLLLVSVAAAAVALTNQEVRKLTRRPPLVFAFGLCAWMIASGLQFAQPSAGMRQGVWFAAVALVVTWTVVAERWETAVLILAVPAAGLIVASIAAVPFADVEFQSNEYFNERLFPWPRLRGLAANHTVIGLSGALLCAVALSFGKAWGTAVSRLILITGVVGILASHSRAAIGAAAVGAIFEVWRSRRELLPLLVGVGLVAIGSWALLGADIALFDRSDEQAQFATDTTSGVDILTGRGEVWVEAISFAERRPLTGNGVGAFSSHTQQQFETGLRQWHPEHAHNLVLELLVDQGLVGVMIMVALVAAVVLLRAHLPLGGVGILVVVGTHSLVEGLFYGSPRTAWFMVVAVLAATARSEMATRRERAAHTINAAGPRHQLIVET